MKNILLIIFIVISSTLYAQEKYKIDESDYDNNQVEMADAMREDGKIYVVVGVILVILLVLIGYIVRVDRKVAAIEKDLFKDDENHNK
ncbi:MAG: CcmD family protein [Candidatus Cyclobacteriaceae bacterium M2_1C_046]